MKISDYIGEATEYDKKETLEVNRPKSWLKSVSAFANGVGGVLIFGVNDEEKLVGLTDVQYISEKISECINARMDPIPQVCLDIYEEEGKKFIILKVLPGNETPYYYVGDGYRATFVRVGNQTIPAGAMDLKRLVLSGSNKTYDSLISEYKYKDYSFTKLRSVYRIRAMKELEESDFLSFGLIDENGMLTNAGALLADDSPIRHSRLFCTRWYGLDKASVVMEALDDKEYSGCLITLLQGGEEFVKHNSKKRWKKTYNGRIEMPDYPERAVLECIVNGLIHRDYLELGSEVHIDIYDDRLEVYSPGGMCDGSIIQNLDAENIPSKRRNPIIADMFDRMNYMERRGSGFKKIKADYLKSTNYHEGLQPKFYSDISSFWVTLYNLNYNAPIYSTEKVDVGVHKVDIEDEKVDVGVHKVDIEDEKVDVGVHKVDIEDEKVDVGVHKVDIEDEKVDVGVHKVDIEDEKVDVGVHKVDIEDEKVDVGVHKVDIEDEKVDVGVHIVDIDSYLMEVRVNRPTKVKIKKIYTQYGLKGIFSRSDISNLLGVTPTSASNMIAKMKQAGLLEPVVGLGKGKYRFK